MFNSEKWIEQADYVLAVLFGEEFVDKSQTHWWEAQRLQLQPFHFPNTDARKLYNALVQLRMVDKSPVHITTVTGIATTISLQWLTQLQTMYGKKSTLTGEVFKSNVGVLMDSGSRAAKIKALQDATQALLNGDDQEVVTSDTLNALNVANMQPMHGETAYDMAQDMRQHLDSPEPVILRSHIACIDEWSNGFGTNEFFAIVAPFKMRKTTLMMNIVLNMAYDNAVEGIAIMMFESDRRVINATLHAMLATKYLDANGWYSPFAMEGDAMQRGISPKYLMQVGGLYKQRNSKKRVEAIDYANAEMKRIGNRIRVYDRTRNGGNLRDIDSVYRVALWDKNRYGTTALFIDHAQRIGSGTDYEKLLKVVPACEALARTEGIMTCLLSQVNGGQVNKDFDQHSSGVKGGTDLDAAIDSLYTVQYRTDVNGSPTLDEELIIGLHTNRYGQSGNKAVVDIDPPSGLILNGGRGRDL